MSTAADQNPGKKSGPKRISFQGEPGAFSHQACVEKFPDYEAVPCATFEQTIDAIPDGRADLAMLPVENTTYGRVADVHTLLPASGLYIIGEHFVRVHANLLGLKGSRLGDIKRAKSHVVLLGQVRSFLRENNIEKVIGGDTAGSAREVAAAGDPNLGAFASELAAQIYGLDVLAHHIEDNAHNTTRFFVCAPEPAPIAPQKDVMTSFIFRVRNIPAALYKAMGGFATNGVNMVKLESYMVGGSFTATQFFADIEGHPAAVARALDELDYFTEDLRILGSYKAAEFRKTT